MGLNYFPEFVKPVEFNPEEMNVGSRLVLYLQRNPGKTAREIAQALDMLDNTVRTGLFRLAIEGEVRKIPRVNGERRSRWEIGEDENYVLQTKPATHMRQSTVSEWTPETRRDDLVAALFGKP